MGKRLTDEVQIPWFLHSNCVFYNVDLQVSLDLTLGQWMVTKKPLTWGERGSCMSGIFRTCVWELDVALS